MTLVMHVAYVLHVIGALLFDDDDDDDDDELIPTRSESELVSDLR